jgi:hypothetical protein
MSAQTHNVLSRKYACDRCDACDRCGGSGKTPYKHIAAGACFKCRGKGTLPYNPQRDGESQDAPEPDYDAYNEQKEREFWVNYDAEQEAREHQQFWEDNGFEAVR